MRKSVLALVGVAVVIVIVGVLISHRGGPNPAPIEPVSTNNPGPLARHTNKPPSPPVPPGTSSNFAILPRTNPIAIPSPNPNLITTWEERLDTILTEQNKSDPDKAKELIAMFPNLSPEAQEEI